MGEITIEMIEAAVPPAELAEGGGAGYENAANHAAKVLLGVARRTPQAFGVALDSFRQDPFCRDIENLMTEPERAALFEGRWGITGFQWGWAVNTVAYLLEQAPVPNPAIWTLSAKE